MQPEESDRQPAELGLTVTDVSWPGEALFDEFDNADEFADYVPVVVAYQVDSPEGEDRHDFILGEVNGVLSDGAYADQLQGDFGIETGGMQMGRDLDEACYRAELPDPWTTELGCIVMLVPDGQTLDSLAWDAPASTRATTSPLTIRGPRTCRHHWSSRSRSRDRRERTGKAFGDRDFSPALRRTRVIPV